MSNILGIGNVLAVAHSLIGFSTIYISRWKQNAPDPNNAGEVMPIYFEPPMQARASVQPVPRDLIVRLGFDLEGEYITVYTDQQLTMRDVARGRAPDMVDFNGLRFNVESNTNWVDQNGWRGSVCCLLGPTP
jgi:hypothetical protein